MDGRLSRRHFICGTASLPLGVGLSMASPAGCAEPEGGLPEFRRGGMLYRSLGRTGINISVLGFGSHTDTAYKVNTRSGNVSFTVLTEEGQGQRDRQIARAFDFGVNILDVYDTQGQREPAARLVRSRRDKVLISCTRQLPKDLVFIGDSIDEAARLFGHSDLFRLTLDGRDPILTPQGDFNSEVLEDWDVLRKAKEVGKVRLIGVSAHREDVMLKALEQLDGLDFVLFPYNFIHARAQRTDFLQRAIRRGVGLVAMKPLAGGSIAQLDPRGRPSRPEARRLQMYDNSPARFLPILPAAMAELTQSLNRLPDETLCQAALRFTYSRPFISCVMTGIFQNEDLDEDYSALSRQLSLSRDEIAVLNKAGELAKVCGPDWVLPQYRWLEEQWRA